MNRPKYKITVFELKAILESLEKLARDKGYDYGTPIAVIRDYSNIHQLFPEEERLITIPWQDDWGKMGDYAGKVFPDNMPDDVVRAIEGLSLDVGNQSWVIYYIGNKL